MEKARYIAERCKDRFHRELGTALLVGAVFLVIPLGLDYLAAPGHFRTFLAYRIVALGVLLALYAANRRATRTAHQLAIAMLALTTVSVMLSAMILAFQGHRSPYAMGLVVLFIFSFGFVPLPFRVALPAAILMYAAYLLPIAILDPIVDAPAFLSTNVLMLSCIGALLLLRYRGEQRLVRELGLQYELEQHQANLELTVAERTALLSSTVARLEAEIEERRRVETALRRSTEEVQAGRALHEQVVSMISDTVWRYEVDAGGRFVDSYISPVADRMLDLPAGTIGHSFERYFSRVHPEDLPAVQQALMRGIRGLAKDASVEYRLRRPDGGELWVRSTGSAHPGSGGNVVAIGTTTDITQHRAAEAERLRRQKLEAVGILAGGIAHDFNNLLQAVLGNISVARLRDADPEKRGAALAEAERALHLSVRLTNQLLTFSRGGLPVKKAIDLLPVVRAYATLALRGSRSALRLSAEDDLWQVDADEGQIGQVVQNIVLNAAQAMPGGGTVDIACRNEQAVGGITGGTLQGDRYVQVTITDSGTGIPEAHLGRIFDPYFTTKPGGTGLGLATSHSIVGNHGGRIEVRSSPGKGTTFVVRLPAVIPASPEAAPRTGGAAPAPPGRVLVMDDEPSIRAVAGELIGALGHAAALATDGAEAVRMYLAAREAGEPFSAVILDLSVPGRMGGAEALRLMRQHDPGVRAIVSSGYSDDDVIANHAAHGFSAFLRKPYHFRELQDALNRVIER